jgi:hypothetical protein
MKKIFLLLWFFYSISSHAIDGNTLSQECNDAVKLLNNDGFATSSNPFVANQQTNNFSLCLGYFQALTDLFGGYLFCPPPSVTYNQSMRITTKYINDNPEKLNQSASVLIIDALSRAFPCSKHKEK